MKVEHKLVNTTLYVGIGGELDEHASHYVRTAMDELFEKKRMSRVILDLSAVSFMDSTGIGVVIGRFKKLKSKGIPLFIANPSVAVDKIFAMSGIYDIMPKIV